MFEILNNKKVGIVVIVIFSIFLYSYLTDNSIQSFDFKGTAESFNLTGQNTEVLFKAKKIHFTTNETVFNNVNNITIESNNGKLKQIDKSPSVKVITNSNRYRPISIDDIDINIVFNLPMSFKYTINRIEISGYMYSPFFKLNGGEVTLKNGGVDTVFIGDEKITDFRLISFKMDNTSSIKVLSNNIELDAFGVSDLIIVGNKLSTISIPYGEGILRLDNHLFDIRNADRTDIKVVPTKESYFEVYEGNIVFNGITNSAKLNNEDQIMSDLEYWLKIQPEKINAYSSLINVFMMLFLVGLTWWYAHSTKKLVSIETDKKKHEKQRFLNILLAELETNSLLLEDLKKSVDMISEDHSKLHEFVFIGFKEDGFNTFRNRGGFEYIDLGLYNKIVDYYTSLYRLDAKNKLKLSIESNEFGRILHNVMHGTLIGEIETIIESNNNLKNELESEIQRI